MSGGTLTVTNDLTVGDVGTFNQSGGTVSVIPGGDYGNLIVNGTYHLSQPDNTNPAVLDVAGTEYIESSAVGAGTFIQDGGTNQISGNLIMARYPGDTATFTLNGGTLSALNCYVAGQTGAAGGTATLNINGGTATIGSIQNGTLTGTTHIWPGGTLNLNPGGTLVTGTMINEGVINNGGGQYMLFRPITGPGKIFKPRAMPISPIKRRSIPARCRYPAARLPARGVCSSARMPVPSGSLDISGGNTTLAGNLGVGNNGSMTGGTSTASGSVLVSRRKPYRP